MNETTNKPIPGNLTYPDGLPVVEVQAINGSGNTESTVTKSFTLTGKGSSFCFFKLVAPEFKWKNLKWNTMKIEVNEMPPKATIYIGSSYEMQARSEERAYDFLNAQNETKFLTSKNFMSSYIVMSDPGKYTFCFYIQKDEKIEKAENPEGKAIYPLTITVAVGGTILLVSFIVFLAGPLYRRCKNRKSKKELKDMSSGLEKKGIEE